MQSQVYRTSLRRLAGRRFASSQTEAVKETAQKQAAEYTDKAKEMASSASAKASQYASQASSAGQRILNSAGGTMSNALGSYREPVLYNLAVAKEIAKQVYIKEGLAPPTSWAEISNIYREMFQKATDISFWRSVAENGQWIRIAVYAVEAIGIFSIGEMIGRRHIVGYKLSGQPPAHH